MACRAAAARMALSGMASAGWDVARLALFVLGGVAGKPDVMLCALRSGAAVSSVVGARNRCRPVAAASNLSSAVSLEDVRILHLKVHCIFTMHGNCRSP
jgi:hypothetical protein